MTAPALECTIRLTMSGCTCRYRSARQSASMSLRGRGDAKTCLTLHSFTTIAAAAEQALQRMSRAAGITHEWLSTGSNFRHLLISSHSILAQLATSSVCCFVHTCGSYSYEHRRQGPPSWDADMIDDWAHGIPASVGHDTLPSQRHPARLKTTMTNRTDQREEP